MTEPVRHQLSPTDTQRALRILCDLIEPENEPCRFDHHGYCQEHGWFGDEPGECGIREARKILGLDRRTTAIFLDEHGVLPERPSCARGKSGQN